MATEAELKEAYTTLYKMCRISKALFADQYKKFGWSGIKQLLELFFR